MGRNITLKELPWGAIVTVLFNIVGGVVFVTVISVQQTNFKEFVALQFKTVVENNDKSVATQKEYFEQKLAAQDAKITLINEKVAVQQNTLDQRGAYGVANSEKTIKIESRLDNLEQAVGAIKDNIQIIVNRIWDEKKPRGVVN